MLVLFDVEFLAIIPAFFNCKFKSFETVLDTAFIITLSFACISVTSKKTVVWTNQVPRFFGTLTQNDDHVSSDEESTICEFNSIICGLGVVVDFNFSLEFLRIH